MIHSIVEFALRQRAVVLVACGVLVVLGIQAFTNLPIEAYPDVADTWVQIITQWPGHAAEEVERQITLPAERVMNGVPRQTAIRSTSIAGLSVVTLIFEDGTDSYFARQQVLERLNQIDLPDGADPKLGPLASPVGEILRYRLVNCATAHARECRAEDQKIAPRPLAELKDLEEWVLERELLATPGVADVVSFGGTVKQYQVLIDPSQLAARGLTLTDVQTALSHANGNAGGGVIAYGPEALNVRGLGLLRPDQIADVPIATHDGTPILVRDVARVQVGYQPRLGRVSVNETSDAVAATILLRKGEQAQVVLDRVHQRIEDINQRVLPRGVKLSAYHDRTDLMHLTTHTVMENLLVGVGLVTLILFVFLGNARAALIVAITIPLSLLIAFICMDGAKIPANLLSIGAVDFGMIVDGSIVMVENIFRLITLRQERGEAYDLRELIRAAAREVARPIVFAIGIIVTAYLPIFTLQRVEGKLFRPMAWTVAFALLGALLLSITLVPVLTTFLFKGKLKEFHNPLLERVRKLYLPQLRWALTRPRWAVLVGLLLLAADGVMAGSIGSEFLPHLDEGAIWMRVSMPANISLAEAESLVDGVHDDKRNIQGVREILRRFPEIRSVATQIGRPDDGTDPTGFYNAEFLLSLTEHALWRPQFHENKDELIAALNAAVGVIPGVALGFSQPISDNVEEALTGVKGQLAVKIVGDDLNALDDIADQIARVIAQVRGVVDLGVFRELGQSNLHVEILRDRAQRYGLSVADIEAVLEGGIGGKPVTQIVEGERRHDLVVRYGAADRDSVDAIKRLLIPVADGRTIPLGQVAEVSVIGGASRIYREQNRRYIAIKFGVRDRDLGGAVADAQARVAKAVHLPRGYTASWGGEFESARRAGKRLAIVIPATIALIFVLLFAMFRRPRESLLILGNVLLTSPFGGLAALLLTGTNFSVSSGVGFLALFGVSVQTGVILVAYINELRAEGRGLDEAIVEAADLRLRPIMMTALVATLGLLPAAMSHGIGSDSQKPLAIVVVGGLISSLALSLFMLPLLYRMFAPPLPMPAPEPAAEPSRPSLPAVASLCLLCLLAPAAVRAQESPAPAADSGMTEAELLHVWLEQSREVASLRTQIGAARFDVVSAGLWPNPQLALTTSTVVAGRDHPPDGVFNWGPQLNIPLPIFGQIGAREREAEGALSVTEMELASTLWSRAADLEQLAVLRAFTGAQIAELERNLSELARIARIVEARAAAGANPHYDVLRVGTTSATFEASLAAARLKRDQLDTQLAAVLAVPGFTPRSITQAGLIHFQGPAQAADLEKVALSRRPDLLLAERGVLAAQASADRYRRENLPLPSLQLGGYVTHDYPSVSLQAGVALNLPLFDRNQGQIGRAEETRRGQQLLAESLRTRIRAEVQGAVRARDAAQQALQAFQQGGVSGARELIERAEVSYQAGGDFSILDLLDAYRAVWEARAQQLELEHSLADAELELARAVAWVGPVELGTGR